ncbi:MAG: thiamine-phosphate kinase [Dehalococcoidia bacterium]
MKTGELGEFGLIDILTGICEESRGEVSGQDALVVGIGDDAAGWNGPDSIQLVTTDMLVENIHFKLSTTSWLDLGWKSMAANISDIAAMGGLPQYGVISLGLPPDTEVESVERLYRGISDISRRYGLVIAGGDVTESPVTVISPAVTGKVEKDRILRRSGAVAGELVAVTGYTGLSAAGLELLEAPDLNDRKTGGLLIEAHLRPSPRVVEGRILGECGVRVAIDTSDGLLADLSHICRSSKVSVRVYGESVPVHPVLRDLFGARSLELALTGGEDYQIVFTASKEIFEEAANRIESPVTVIGEVTGDEPGGPVIIDGNGKSIEYNRGGWEHFSGR